MVENPYEPPQAVDEHIPMAELLPSSSAKAMTKVIVAFVLLTLFARFILWLATNK